MLNLLPVSASLFVTPSKTIRSGALHRVTCFQPLLSMQIIMSIHNQSVPIRAIASTAQNTLLSIFRPSRIRDFAVGWTKFPVGFAASRAHNAVPAVVFSELFKNTDQLNQTINGASLDRHVWNVKLHEEIYLSAAIQSISPDRIFEIGTFDGNTTRRMAEAAPDTARVFTIDLPEAMFDATQIPDSFCGSRVGERYLDSPARSKIKQIRADTTTFDFTPYHESIDLVFVDAAHDYPHGLADSRTALKIVRPGGTIFWHDFEPYWSGLVHAICEATAGLPLRRLAGTSFAVLRVPNR
jgi:predicted O-methyltransferase YrrM